MTSLCLQNNTFAQVGLLLLSQLSFPHISSHEVRCFQSILLLCTSSTKMKALYISPAFCFVALCCIFVEGKKKGDANKSLINGNGKKIGHWKVGFVKTKPNLFYSIIVGSPEKSTPLRFPITKKLG